MNAPIDISNTELRTERLLLRPWQKSDLEDFYEYASVEGVGEMAGWPHHENRETSKTILNSFIEGKKTFALVYKGKVIGSLGIEEYSEKLLPEDHGLKGREIGFVLSKDYWGLGLMPEAVKEVIRYLFEEVKLDFIFCSHFTDNPQSQKVQMKCGFKPVGTGTLKTLYGETKDTIVNLLTRKQWEEISYGFWRIG